MKDEYFESHSSFDTNSRIDIILMQLHDQALLWDVQGRLDAVSNYVSLIRRLYIEVRPRVVRHMKRKKKDAEVMIDEARRLVEVAQMPPRSRPIKANIHQLLGEAYDIMYELECDIREVLDRMGFFFRTSGGRTRSIQAWKP